MYIIFVPLYTCAAIVSPPHYPNVFVYQSTRDGSFHLVVTCTYFTLLYTLYKKSFAKLHEGNTIDIFTENNDEIEKFEI